MIMATETLKGHSNYMPPRCIVDAHQGADCRKLKTLNQMRAIYRCTTHCRIKAKPSAGENGLLGTKRMSLLSCSERHRMRILCAGPFADGFFVVVI